MQPALAKGAARVRNHTPRYSLPSCAIRYLHQRPFSVSPGTLLKVEMVGEGIPGDPDVYVRYKDLPTQKRYNCRPYLVGAEEICSLDVPPKGVTQAYVMVRGYSEGNYSLTVVHVPNQ